MYSSSRMKRRLTEADEEALFTAETELGKAAYLRRKVAQGRGL
jgi:hypothetical protein